MYPVSDEDLLHLGAKEIAQIKNLSKAKARNLKRKLRMFTKATDVEVNICDGRIT